MTEIEPELQMLLEGLAVEGEAHDRRESDHSKQMLNLEPATAELLAMLVRSSGLVGAGLRDRVELRCGEATDLVSQQQGGLDCVFFDADRTGAPQQLEILLPILDQDVLLLADNATSHPEEISGYLMAVEGLPGVAHTVVPVGKGLSVAHRR